MQGMGYPTLLCRCGVGSAGPSAALSFTLLQSTDAPSRCTPVSPPTCCAPAGGAKYIPTGRGYAIKHNTFVKVRPALLDCWLVVGYPLGGLWACPGLELAGGGQPVNSRDMRNQPCQPGHRPRASPH